MFATYITVTTQSSANFIALNAVLFVAETVYNASLLTMAVPVQVSNPFS